MLLERGILCFLCTLRGAFRTRNTLFFVHFARCFKNKGYFVFYSFRTVLLERGILCFLCTLRGTFRRRDTNVFRALRALLFSTTKITVGG